MNLRMMLRVLFTRNDRATLLLLAFLMVLSGFLEVFGIGMLIQDTLKCSSRCRRFVQGAV